MMNKLELKSVMTKHGDTYSSVAEYLGITEQSFYRKINEKTSFNQPEIMKLIKKYKLKATDVNKIFFDL